MKSAVRWLSPIEYLVVPVVPPGAEPTLAIGRQPNAASILAILVSFYLSGDSNLTIRFLAPKCYSALPFLMDWHAWVLFLM